MVERIRVIVDIHLSLNGTHAGDHLQSRHQFRTVRRNVTRNQLT